MTSHTSPLARFHFGLLGAGRVGTAVSCLLRAAGHVPVGVWSRSEASARKAARSLGSRTVDSPGDLGGCEVVLIGASDPAIADVAGTMAPHVAPGVKVVHFAGSLGLEPLGPVTHAGALACALHPVQSCPDVDRAVRRLPGSAWGVTCSTAAEDWAIGLVEGDLAGRTVKVAETDRRAWHAAAVMTSNGLAALLGGGEAVLRALQVDAPRAVLAPLAEGTLRNAVEADDGIGLTGPVARGETATVEGHLSALADVDQGLAEIYADVARVIVSGALWTGGIDDRTAHEMRRLLERT